VVRIVKKEGSIGHTKPMNGAALNITVARPRSSGESRSAITPPAFGKRDAPNDPARTRKMINVWMCCEPADAQFSAV